MKKFVYVIAVPLAAYVAAYVLLRAVSYIHVIGSVGLGGNGYQVECYWLHTTGKPRLYTAGTAALYLFWPCWQIECGMMRSSANKSVETNHRSAGPFQDGLEFKSTSCAPPFRSAAVAHLNR
jgi:hypothetical protein